MTVPVDIGFGVYSQMDHLTEKQQRSRRLMQQLIRLMAVSKMPYVDIAKRAGLCESTIHNWIDGKTLSPRLANVLAVFEVIGYDLMPVKRARFN